MASKVFVLCPQRTQTFMHLDDSHLSSVLSLCHAALALLLNRNCTQTWSYLTVIILRLFSVSVFPQQTGQTPPEELVKGLKTIGLWDMFDL